MKFKFGDAVLIKDHAFYPDFYGWISDFRWNAESSKDLDYLVRFRITDRAGPFFPERWFHEKHLIPYIGMVSIIESRKKYD